MECCADDSTDLEPTSDDDVLDLFAVTDDAEIKEFEAAGFQRLPDITMDSGAGLSVANASQFPGSVVKPSAGSQRGQKLVAAAGKVIDNRGEFTSELLVETGEMGKLNFADADVRKPLLAVSSCNSKGNPVWFDGHRSYWIPAGAPQLEQIRQLIAGIDKKIKLHLENGTYKMRAWKKPSGPFQGPWW